MTQVGLLDCFSQISGGLHRTLLRIAKKVVTKLCPIAVNEDDGERLPNLLQRLKQHNEFLDESVLT